MKIWMPTSNEYVWAANASLKLLGKYWPGHPVVDVTCFESPPLAALMSKRCNVVKLGEQAGLTWVQAAIRYLEWYGAEDVFLLMLDDYGCCRYVDRVDGWWLEDFESHLRTFPMISSVALTWQPCDGIGDDAIYEFPRWDYSFNTQAGIWRRDDLLRIMKNIPAHEQGVWQMEVAGSRYFNEVMHPQGKRMVGWNIPRPHNASGFVDETDKSGWLIAYNNLANKGGPDPRHADWLAKELAT